MKIEFGLLCEAATALPDGRINVLGGGLDAVSLPKFPSLVSMHVLLRGVIEEGDRGGLHDFTLSLRDADGRPVHAGVSGSADKPVEVRGKFQIPIATTLRKFNLIAQMVLPLPRPGSFEIRTEIDGARASQSLPFQASEVVTA